MPATFRCERYPKLVLHDGARELGRFVDEVLTTDDEELAERLRGDLAQAEGIVEIGAPEPERKQAAASKTPATRAKAKEPAAPAE